MSLDSLSAQPPDERFYLLLLVINITLKPHITTTSLFVKAIYSISLLFAFDFKAFMWTLTLIQSFVYYYQKLFPEKTQDKGSTQEFRVRKSYDDAWDNSDKFAVPLNWHDIGRKYKDVLNDLSTKDFNTLRFKDVTEGARGLNDPSRGSKKLRSLLAIFSRVGIEIKGTFIDMCAGAGGWSHVLREEHNLKGEAISFWTPGHEQWAGPVDVKTYQGDFKNMKPKSGYSLLLFDGGESHKMYDKEKSKFALLFSKVPEWVAVNPDAHFIFKVLTPSCPLIQSYLTQIQQMTGKGELVRLTHSRLSNAEMYFISTPPRFVKAQAYRMYSTLIDLINNKDPAFSKPSDTYENQGVPDWEAIPNLDVPLLPQFDMHRSVEECTIGQLRPARNITKFLKEIGYFLIKSRGSTTTFYNSYVRTLTYEISKRMPMIDAWKTTGTTAKSIFRMVGIKIDQAPVEQHQHWSRIAKAYKVMSEYVTQQGGKLRRLQHDEMIAALNPNGSMGIQENAIIEDGTELCFRSIKEYATYKHPGQNDFLYKKRLKKLKQSYDDGSPMLGVFNTVAKTEKKVDTSRTQDKASRLIWFLPATTRIYEALTFGSLEDLLKKIPYCVSGIPLYDYGEQLADIFFKRKNRVAICNDIAGWDTKISYGLLCMEANFLMNMTHDPSLKQDILNLYRVYANSIVMIARDGPEGDEMALYNLRGQVASGRRTTYGMNTITNIVLSITAAAHAYDIPDADFEKWMMNILRSGHSSQFGGKISGDDSALIFSDEYGRKFASKAHEFLNDIGLIRKDMLRDSPSEIIHDFGEIDFCSHHYIRVTYGKRSTSQWGARTVDRYMPIRDFSEIIGKARIMLAMPKDTATQEAWARCQGLQLMVNYHHIPEVKALALALLSATRENLMLESLSTGWQLRAEPWIQQGDVLDIITKCLFGESTTITKLRDTGLTLTHWNELGQIDFSTRRRFVGMKTSIRKLWYSSIPDNIILLRTENKGYYKDWNQSMQPIWFKNVD